MSATRSTPRHHRSRRPSHPGGHLHGPHAIDVGERPDPVIDGPTDAFVRVVLSCVCGSDLWYYRGESPHDLGAIGHEFTGVVNRLVPRCEASRMATSSS